ncbi:hypothetical protein [Bacillus sp. NPDC094106]|uniref:hypothetical protein n=1 Tax=Bacillus sp. NPDC094106 TaxID=3363949 RepID=UPI00381C5810
MYLKELEKLSDIPDDLRQTFQNKFTNTVSKNEIIKMKNNGKLTERDLDIAKFLFKFRFATAEQIQQYLEVLSGNPEDGSSIYAIRNRLEKLVQNRVLNKFMLGDFEEEHMKQDAFPFYCLDLGGKYLVTHYSNEDTFDWYMITNMKTSEIIVKDLISTQFYLQLMKTCPGKIVFFNVNPELRVGNKNIIPSFEFCMKLDGLVGQHRYFIGEIGRDADVPLLFRQKSEKLEQLITTNAWKKYYYDSDIPPVLFIVSETDVLAKECGKILDTCTEIKNYRFTTYDRMKRPLYEKGAFLKYVPDVEALMETKAVTFKE